MLKLDIKVELGKGATPTMIKEFEPEAVVVATGAVPIVPEKWNGKRFNTVNALEVLGGFRGIKERIVVVGGGLIGCETAEFLSEQYKDIIILEMLEKIGSDIGPTLRPHLLERMKAAGIQTEVGVKITEINDKGVMGLRDGRSEFYNAGTIVIAIGMKSENQFAQDLKSIIPGINVVGDCINPRRIREAIAEGYNIGLKI
jgi:NADPH-dependent 2,4-dienoyl-CoA reductase/sulfur reductase-like enzyme